MENADCTEISSGMSTSTAVNEGNSIFHLHHHMRLKDKLFFPLIF